jgi:hypothetical protein
MNFNDILAHEFSPFLTFCRSQHVEESLLFWNAVEAFRKRALQLEHDCFSSHPPKQQSTSWDCIICGCKNEMKVLNCFGCHSSKKAIEILEHEKRQNELNFQLTEMAKCFVSTFLQLETASACICISQQDRDKIDEKISHGKVTHSIFDQIQLVVYLEMKDNIYPLFLDDKKIKLFPQYFKSKKVGGMC